MKVASHSTADVIISYIDLVQQAMSEKVALIINAAGAFFAAFAIAYARSWRLALALSSMLPCIVVTGAVMNKFVVALSQ